MMSRRPMRRASTCCAIAMLAAFAVQPVPLAAQEAAQEPAQDVSPPPPALREAQAVLLAAYPELSAARIGWRSTATEAGFVLLAHAVTEPFADPAETPALVVTEAALDPDGRLATLAIDGLLSGRARLRTLQQRSDPAATVVREAGGRFVPGEADAASQLVAPGLLPAVGRGRVADVVFEVAGGVDAEALTWRVEVEADGGRRVLVFEPIEGRLLGLVAR
jgi:hypothetical protein